VPVIVPRLRAPIVLVHGLFGFDEIRLGRWLLAAYFRGIPEALARGGNRVLVARLSPTAGVADRAAQLQAFLDSHLSGEPAHLFCHSMGGLDGRYMVSRLGMAPRVLTLTTLGTPHRGSPFADWGVRRFERLLRPLLVLSGIPFEAFYDLTVERCRRFNEQTPDAPGVRYFSVAGRFRPTLLWPEWQLPARVLERAEGPNDGVVSVASATWGESCEVWDEGDHLNLVNWPRRGPPGRRQKERVDEYVRLVRRLADEGF
jgi:triacylglycerol lipase